MLAVGFLIGMVPAMLLVGFFGGRHVEKQRKELKLQYDRQIVALRATIQRLMQRIDLLGGERAQLKRSNKNFREALREQRRLMDDTKAELMQSKEQMEKLAAENLRHEGRLEEARIQQDHMEAQFAQIVSQFTEADRLRQHLLFATNQLRSAHASNQAIGPAPEKQTSNTQDQEPYGSSTAELDVAVIEGLEPLYVERLHDSGIHTIADLAGQTPARVAHFAGLSSWDESTRWIAEAKALLATPPYDRV
jgi:predicted flap endonuclease-1-like 5' DNA nuclease